MTIKPGDISTLFAGPPEDAEEAAYEQKIRDEKKAKIIAFAKAHKKILGAAMAVILLGGVFIWFGMQPLRGPVYVGLCRSYAELQLDYPETFRIMQYEFFDRGHRLYYTYTDPFGEYRSSMIECRFSVTSYGTIAADSIQIDRIAVGKEKLDVFNKTIPIILSYEPNNIIPVPPKGGLVELKID